MASLLNPPPGMCRPSGEGWGRAGSRRVPGSASMTICSMRRGTFAPSAISMRSGDEARHYDQIARSLLGRRKLLTLEFSIGQLRLRQHVLTKMSSEEPPWRISDHYPTWAEFGVTTTGAELVS